MRILLVLLLFLSSFANAQPPQQNIYKGIEDFILGNSLSSFGNTIQFIDSFTFNGKKEYHYIRRFETQVVIAGAIFNEAILTFDERKFLAEIDMSSIYTERLHKDPKAKAHADLKNLDKYIVGAAKKFGTKKTEFNSLKADGYEWGSDLSTIWLYIQKLTGKSYGITLHWQRAE